MLYRAIILLTGVAAAAPAMAQSEAEPVAFAAAATVDDAVLGKIAGREDTGAQVAIADQRNVVAGNSADNSTTGNIRIDGNAFQNLQGLSVISANSGNNVAINSAMNVTINLAPMP